MKTLEVPLVHLLVAEGNCQEIAIGKAPIISPRAFTANDCLDVGSDPRSPGSLDHFDKAPFKLSGALGTSHFPKKTS